MSLCCARHSAPSRYGIPLLKGGYRGTSAIFSENADFSALARARAPGFNAAFASVFRLKKEPSMSSKPYNDDFAKPWA